MPAKRGAIATCYKCEGKVEDPVYLGGKAFHSS